MEPKEYPTVKVKQREIGTEHEFEITLRVWQGPTTKTGLDGGITVHNDKMGIIANVPKKSALYDQLNRLIQNGTKVY